MREKNHLFCTRILIEMSKLAYIRDCYTTELDTESASMGNSKRGTIQKYKRVKNTSHSSCFWYKELMSIASLLINYL